MARQRRGEGLNFQNEWADSNSSRMLKVPAKSLTYAKFLENSSFTGFGQATGNAPVGDIFGVWACLSGGQTSAHASSISSRGLTHERLPRPVVRPSRPEEYNP